MTRAHPEQDLFINPQDYYAQPGPLTRFSQDAALLDTLPQALPDLVEAQQGLIVHVFWAGRYGLALTPERQAEVQLRPAGRKLARMLELDPSPLGQPRPLERRLVGNCRDISVFLTAVLRSRGIPARARCGFGTYFIPNHFEDHWVVETWDAAAGRWVMVDAQLDPFQRDKLGIRFNSLDMPPGQFITGGQAWLMARRGEADPETFGIFEYHGLDFIRGNLIRDLAALNKVETLPWDFFGTLLHPLAEASPEELAWLDGLAELTLGGDDCFNEVRRVYETRPELQPPAEWLEEVG